MKLLRIRYYVTFDNGGGVHYDCDSEQGGYNARALDEAKPGDILYLSCRRYENGKQTFYSVRLFLSKVRSIECFTDEVET